MSLEELDISNLFTAWHRDLLWVVSVLFKFSCNGSSRCEYSGKMFLSGDFKVNLRNPEKQLFYDHVKFDPINNRIIKQIIE